MAYLFTLLGGLALFAVVDANASEERLRIVRHEGKQQKPAAGQALLTPGGMLMEASRHQQATAAVTSAPASAAAVAAAATAPAAADATEPADACQKWENQDKKGDVCDEVFAYGTEHGSDCPANFCLIDNEVVCEAAANEFKDADGNAFLLGSKVFAAGQEKDFIVLNGDSDQENNAFPKGCFGGCVADTSTPPICVPTGGGTALDKNFFFNKIGDSPSCADTTNGATPSCNGKAVCHRKKWEVFADVAAAATASDYVRVLDEIDCRTFAACKGYEAGDDPDFQVGVPAKLTDLHGNPVLKNAKTAADDDRIADSENYDSWPKGCFTMNVGNKENVYFNVPREAEPTSPDTHPGTKPVSKINKLIGTLDVIGTEATHYRAAVAAAHEKKLADAQAASG